MPTGRSTEHRAVSRLHYPGCNGHPGHRIAKARQHSFDAMLSFGLGGDEAAVRAFVDGLASFTLAGSLGGV